MASRILTATGSGSSVKARCAAARSAHTRRGGVVIPRESSRSLAAASSAGSWIAAGRVGDPDCVGCAVEMSCAGILHERLDAGRQRGGTGHDRDADLGGRGRRLVDRLGRAAGSENYRYAVVHPGLADRVGQVDDVGLGQGVDRQGVDPRVVGGRGKHI